MLRVVVESARGLPKKRVGSPDPITTIKFRGESLDFFQAENLSRNKFKEPKPTLMTSGFIQVEALRAHLLHAARRYCRGETN